MIATRSAADRPLRIAVPKGALFADSVRALATAGLDVGGARRPGPAAHHRARRRWSSSSASPPTSPSTSPTARADCGIAGKDVLVEPGLDVVELVDLRLRRLPLRGRRARERAAPRSSEHYRHLGVIRVATKYPQHHGGALRRARRAGRDREAQRQHRARAAHRPRRPRSSTSRPPGRRLRENRLRIVEDVLAVDRALRRQPGGRAHRPARDRACRHACRHSR